jgi:hypothetical protein
MIPEEEIYSNIVDMGYVTAKPRQSFASFYRLTDGTLLKVVFSLNYLLPDPRQPDAMTINSTNIISTFVSKDKRKPEAFVPHSRAELRESEDIEFEVLQENFSVYDLSNGFVLSVKPVVAQVLKTKFYNKEGEPIYSVNVNPIVKIKKH